MSTRMRAVAVGAVGLAMILATSTTARADDNQFAQDFGMGLGAAGANLLYMPTKVVYATLGGLTGGFAYGLTGGNLDVAKKVWNPSMGGTYVVTPTMLRGEERVMFSGTTEPMETETELAYSGQQSAAPAPPESAPVARAEEGASEPYQGY